MNNDNSLNNYHQFCETSGVFFLDNFIRKKNQNYYFSCRALLVEKEQYQLVLTSNIAVFYNERHDIIRQQLKLPGVWNDNALYTDE